MAQSEVQIPLSARLRLSRAAVQTLARVVGADILHIKGDSVSPELGLVPLSGTDVDILVRPAHVDRLHTALSAHGWSVYSSFTYGSPFEHAQTYRHPLWGYLDLHRLFPGIRLQPDTAFEHLWRDRRDASFADIAAVVPSPTAQRLILLLNAARSPRPDVTATLWTDAEPRDRVAIGELADVLDARVGLAAATGDLERYRGERAYPLWKLITAGGSRAAEWRARVRAAPTRSDRVRIVLRAPRVNVEHLAHRLGRTPTRADIAREFFARPLVAVRSVVRRSIRR